MILLKLKEEEGVIYTGNPKILKKICPGSLWYYKTCWLLYDWVEDEKNYNY